MKIGLNGQNLFTKYPAGPERYSYKVYQSLAIIDKINDYTVYLNSEPTIEEWESLSKGNNKFKYKVIKKIISWGQISLFFELISNKVDLYFSPIHSLPGLAQIFIKKTRFIVMIHGLEYIINKLDSHKVQQLIHKPVVINWIVRTADKIIVPSNSTMEELRKMYPSNTSKIIRIPEGVDEYFYKRNYDEISEVKKKFSLSNDDEYLFFLSTIQPRKNIPGMIEGFSKLVKGNEKYKNLKLLIGGKKGWNFEEALKAPGRYDVSNNVLFIGRPEDIDLPALFSGAKGYINMSFQEGFGLTALEAMACSCPLILSDISAHKEIAGSYGNYADPQNTDEISSLIYKVLEDPDHKKIESALYAARTFTWESTARNTLDVFIKAYEKR